MNLIFLTVFGDVQNFFDRFFTNINTNEISGSTGIDLVRSFFEHNPVDTGVNSDFLSQGLANLQNVIAEISGGSGSLIASAPVLLLAASVVIILGVLGEAFFKKTGIPDIAFLMVLGVIIGPILGGLLANPAGTYPKTFGHINFFIHINFIHDIVLDSEDHLQEWSFILKKPTFCQKRTFPFFSRESALFLLL